MVADQQNVKKKKKEISRKDTQHDISYHVGFFYINYQQTIHRSKDTVRYFHAHLSECIHLSDNIKMTSIVSLCMLKIKCFNLLQKHYVLRSVYFIELPCSMVIFIFFNNSVQILIFLCHWEKVSKPSKSILKGISRIKCWRNYYSIQGLEV